MPRRHTLCLVFAVIVAAMGAGCSAKGAAFTRLSPLPADKGVVYIYRQSSFVGGGVYGTVKANDAPVTRIKNGGYYPYVAAPGPVHFSVTTEATNTADVTVKPGEEKYLKTTVGMGFFIGHLYLTEVSSQLGEQEIGECKLLDPALP